MFRVTIIPCLLFAASLVNCVDVNWYKNALVYQIYPRSFQDSNGDGIGDLNGITARIAHVADIGAQALWLSPIYKSPQVDFGYDISNFTDIDPVYGTLADFDRLVKKAKSFGLKVILDFVPNHSSHEHPWFKKSVQRIKPYDEYYVWRDARIVNGTRQPPNNWLSVFWNSAWEWNDVRQQYYLHQFATGQPDLNYRSAALDREMKNVLTFWLDRGVDGFRIDAINHMFEDARMLDEPSANRTDLSKNDYESLVHVYTRDQDETYEVLKSWRNLMDEHSNRTNSDPRMILTEAYADFDLTIKYYKSGSTVPFNFMFITDLNNQSTASDFKQLIDRWVGNVPDGSVTNWVSGNHDNHRVASRFGRQRADEIIMLTLTLPGIGVVYNGDEIGMEDRSFTYEETVDPAGCNAGPAKYYLKSRDPERTPYQWDNSTSAGFSDRKKTWLPVNDNYKSLNLAAQKKEYYSHYVAFKSMSYLKQQPVIANGSLEVNVIDGRVLSVKRQLGNDTVIVMMNFSNHPATVNITELHPPGNLVVYAHNVVGSGLSHGNWIYPASMTIPPSNSAIFTNYELYWQFWKDVDWL
ncbi:alpha-glucosidase-like [Apis laboriosa]|uniref:alpha-glucosidase-like n=1 Tax=Apis laboriosa TaxID=183418 RepID=UPI001CC73CE3|nr:alpha-glucosidase-like [Apis laboriosa]